MPLAPSTGGGGTSYVHRAGRTARAGREGLSIALVSPPEKKRYAALCYALGQPEGFPAFPVDAEILPRCRERVKLALRLDSIVRAESQKRAHADWVHRTAAALEIEVDDDEAGGRRRRGGGGGEDDEDGGEAVGKGGRKKRDAREAAQLRAELDELLSQPLAAGFSSKYLTSGPRQTGNIPLALQKLERRKAAEAAAEAKKKKKGGTRGAAKKGGKFDPRQWLARAKVSAASGPGRSGVSALAAFNSAVDGASGSTGPPGRGPAPMTERA